MASLTESHQVAFVAGSKLPASSPFSLSRLIVPFLCVSIGMSVGSAAGLTLALVNSPNDTVAASSDSAQAGPASQSGSIQAGSASADVVTSVAMNARPAPIMQPAGPAPLTGDIRQPAMGTIHSIAKSAVTKAHAQNTVQIALNRTPDAVKPAMFRLAGKEWRVARPIAIPVVQPVWQGLASAPQANPTALDTAQSGLNAAAKPASLYTEGDLTVADFDATDGTLEASDGRTFVLGTTVATSDATSWDSYHSLVHYRCDQGGGCVLMRAGAVAPNARLI